MSRLIKKLYLLAVFILVFSGTLFAAETEMILESGIVDLRGTRSIPSRDGNEPGALPTPEDLEIGTIFLTVDNHARKVVDIYEHNGRTIIETIEPRPEEVFLALYVPDFEVSLGRENIAASSIADGVTLLPPDAGRGDMLSSEFTPPSEVDRSVTWLETDSGNDGKDVIAVNINIPLAGVAASAIMLDKLKTMQDDAKEAARLEQEEADNPDGQASTDDSGTGDSTDGSSDDSSSKPKSELSFSADGEIWLKGTMRLVEPTFSGGVKKPKLKFSWVSKWWGGYFKISHESGYIKGGFRSAQQLDLKLTGTVTLAEELKVPVYAIVFTYDGVTAILGVYIKIGLSGTISVAVEVSEYSTSEVEAKCNLVWPFIPTKIEGSSDHYSNVAYRPIVSAEAELKAGLYLGADLEVLGIGILGAEAGGGAYIRADGYMEPMSIMGYDDNIGSYGNFDNWILALNAEAGVYAEINATILSVDLDLWSQRWPFWEWHKDWEL